MSELAPKVDKYEKVVPGVPTAGNDDSFAIGEAKFAGVVIGISYIPDAASTGDNTNKRVYTLVNKGQSGAGSTVIGTLDLVTGVNLVAFDEKPFTLSGTPANLNVAEGDVLAFVSTHGGTGLVDPGGTLIVEISRT